MELILKGQNRTVTDMHQYCHLEAMVDSVEEENGHHEQQQHLHLQVWPTDAGGTLYPQTLIDHNSHSQGVDFISSNSPYGHHSYPPQPYSQQYPLRQQPPQSYTPLSHTPPSYDQHRQQRNRRISEESIHFSSPDASAKRDWISRSPTLPLRRSSFTGSPYREITYSNYPLVPWEDPGPSYLSYNSPSNHAVDPSLLHDLHTLAAAAVAVPSRSRFPTGENDIYLESPLTSPSHKRHQRLESAGYDRPVTNAVRRTNQKGDRQNMAVSADMPSHHVQGPSFTNPNKRRASPASQESAESGEDSFRSPKPNNLRGHFEATAPVIEGPSTGDMVSENSELERPRYDGHVPLRTLRTWVDGYFSNPYAECTIVVTQSIAAQKSYGTEKRFFTPPILRLFGEGWGLDCLKIAGHPMTRVMAENRDFASVGVWMSAVKPQPDECVVGNEDSDRDTSLIQSPYPAAQLALHHTRVERFSRTSFFAATHQVPLPVLTATWDRLYISDDDTRKCVPVWYTIKAGTTGTLSYEGRPFYKVSKPSKKKIVGNGQLILLSGQTLTLFSRYKCQGQATRFLCVDDSNDLEARCGIWDNWMVFNMSDPRCATTSDTPHVARRDSATTPIHYGEDIILENCGTGVRINGVRFKKLESNKRICNAGLGDEPVGLLHKVVIEADVGYMTVLPQHEDGLGRVSFVKSSRVKSTRETSKKRKGHEAVEGGVGEESVWTVVGTEISEVTFWKVASSSAADSTQKRNNEDDALSDCDLPAPRQSRQTKRQRRDDLGTLSRSLLPATDSLPHVTMITRIGPDRVLVQGRGLCEEGQWFFFGHLFAGRLEGTSEGGTVQVPVPEDRASHRGSIIGSNCHSDDQHGVDPILIVCERGVVFPTGFYWRQGE